MVTTLRLVLDQLVDIADTDTAEASLQVAAALAATAPARCEVGAIVPSDAMDAAAAVPGVASAHRAPLPRVGLVAAWQMGVAPGIGGGLIHAATPLAPLVKHDRAHDNDQTVVTVWDLTAWDAPDRLSRAAVVTQRALLKRAEKHADAVVVPAHAVADRLAEISPKLASRLRVIPGAPPEGFRAPSDAVGRRRDLGIPDRVVAVAGGTLECVRSVLGATGEANDAVAIVLLDAPDDVQSAVEASGIDAARVHVLERLDAWDRAAVLETALVLVSLSDVSAFPWRAVEAMALGVPVVAAESAVHREVLLDGGVVVEAAELRDAVLRVLASVDERRRWSVRAGDRGRAFSWRDHAERVWALHAEL